MTTEIKNGSAVLNDVSVGQAIAELATSWNAGDAEAYAAPFTEDASYITFFGLVDRGRDAIRTRHDTLFNGPGRGSKLIYTEEPSTRYLGPGAALVVIHGGIAFHGGAVPDKGCESAFTYVLVEGREGVRFAAFQNTRILPDFPA